MKPRLIPIFCTLLGFGAGAGACYWALRAGRLPPPPATLFSEYRDILRLHPLPESPLNRAAIFRQAMRLWPQIEQYRREMAALDTGFRAQIDASLRADQRAVFAELVAERRRQVQEFRQVVEDQPGLAPTEGPAPQPLALRERLLLEPLVGLASIVQVGSVMEMLTAKLNLDSKQQAEIRALLINRRTQFLEFMDKQPPPSMSLGVMFEPRRQTQP